MAVFNILVGLLVAYVTGKLLWVLIRTLAIRYTTILNDIPLLRLAPPKKEHRIHGTAVVVGGSVAGYLTARILVDYFTEVIIVEADTKLEMLGSRVGQRAQLHVYTAVGFKVLRNLFTNFQNEMKKDGAVVAASGDRWILGRARMSYAEPGLNISRLTFERSIRRLVTLYAGDSLKVIEGTVTGVKASQDGTSVESVLVRPSSDSTESLDVQTAFFTDCSGPSAVSSKYLASSNTGADWGNFKKHSYTPGVSYVSAFWHVPEHLRDKIARMLPEGDPDHGRWDSLTIIQTFSPTADIGKHLYSLQKVDGDRLLFLHCGWGLEHHASNLTEFAEVVHNVQDYTFGNSPLKKRHEFIFNIIDLIQENEPDIDSTLKFVHYKMGLSQWIEFEAGKLPDNFVAVGDSRMRVNPAFGQGVGKSLMDITVLNKHFHTLFSQASSLPPTIPPSFGRNYFKDELSVVKGMYDINRALDYGYESTIPEEGETREYGKLLRQYWQGVLDVIDDDRAKSSWITKVVGGLEPGVELFHPLLILRILLNQQFGIKI